MTEPLTPADCDLQDFAFMPLDVVRLRDSELAIHVTAEEFRCAVLLWCASWHQVPAASLPDDDKSLASLAGLGRVVSEWMKQREGALRGWVKCSDGRLYHPVVAEKANDAWAAKHRHAYEKLQDRVRKLNKARHSDGLEPFKVPPFDEWMEAGRPAEKELFPPENRNIPAESGGNSGGKDDASGGNGDEFQRNDGGIPGENALKGQGQGQGQGYKKEKEIGESGGKLSRGDPADDPPPPPVNQDRATQIAVWLRKSEKARGKQPAGTISSDPRIQAWSQRDITDAQLAEAYELAVADRDAAQDMNPIGPGFLEIFVSKVLNPPPVRTKQRSDSNDWTRTTAGIDSKGREMGMYARSGESYDGFKDRILVEIRKRERDAREAA